MFSFELQARFVVLSVYQVSPGLFPRLVSQEFHLEVSSVFLESPLPEIITVS